MPLTGNSSRRPKRKAKLTAVDSEDDAVDVPFMQPKREAKPTPAAQTRGRRRCQATNINPLAPDTHNARIDGTTQHNLLWWNQTP
jgi:hypothetical protein